jgi:peptidoglycan hydrolase CwlO-like protein
MFANKFIFANGHYDLIHFKNGRLYNIIFEASNFKQCLDKLNNIKNIVPQDDLPDDITINKIKNSLLENNKNE